MIIFNLKCILFLSGVFMFKDCLACFFVISGFICAAIIGLDILLGRRQKMGVMDIVWPLTGLWAGWLGLWFYFSFGRTPKKRDSIPDSQGMEKMGDMHMDMPGMDGMQNMGAMKGEKKEMNMSVPGMQDMKGTEHVGMKDMEMSGMQGMAMPPYKVSFMQAASSTLHCGAGCTLADIIGECFTFFVPVYIVGSLIAGQWVLDYILALIIGVFFQYAVVKGMSRLSPAAGAWKALKIDFFSLTAWQIGMYGCMAVVLFIVFPGGLPKTGYMFWFMMQIAMFCGFCTSLPVNYILIKKGIKKVM